MNEEKQFVEKAKGIILFTILLIIAGVGLSLYSSVKGDTMTGIRALTVDKKGNVFFIANFTLYKLDPQGNIVFSVGEEGSAPGQFGQGFPLDLCVDKDDNTYVGDILNYRIQKFDRTGKCVFAFGTAGTAPGTFGSALEIAVDESGFIYAVESTNNRLQKFDKTGKLVFVKGGTESRDFDFPHDPFIAHDGNIYIADFRKARVQSFNPDGRFIAEYATLGSADKSSTSPELFTYHYPQRITEDTKHNFYLLNYNKEVTRGLIYKYDSSFKLINKIDLSAQGIDFISFPAEIACGPDDDLFLSREEQIRISRIDAQGNYKGDFGSAEVAAQLDALRTAKQKYESQKKAGQAMAIIGLILALVVFFRHKREAEKKAGKDGLVRKID